MVVRSLGNKIQKVLALKTTCFGGINNKSAETEFVSLFTTLSSIVKCKSIQILLSANRILGDLQFSCEL